MRAGLLEASTLLADVASLPASAVAVLSLLFSKTLTTDLGAAVLRSAAGGDIAAFVHPRLAQRVQPGSNSQAGAAEDTPMQEVGEGQSAPNPPTVTAS